jgi:hypothetical protein
MVKSIFAEFFNTLAGAGAAAPISASVDAAE